MLKKRRRSAAAISNLSVKTTNVGLPWQKVIRIEAVEPEGRG